ncbi:hypothetical protein RRG08_036608 [Elysia crispata]|uniref:Uncharacterized protein n=1 Tax=Elysia crispata TaxID=231223 RepID=A0AAE0ZQV9_9GAST|nr:hypothetical protein RRG08_036608 [Elysia crispata]
MCLRAAIARVDPSFLQRLSLGNHQSFRLFLCFVLGSESSKETRLYSNAQQLTDPEPAQIRLYEGGFHSVSRLGEKRQELRYTE